MKKLFNKKLFNLETLAIAALIIAMMAWGPLYQKYLAPPPMAVPPPSSTNGLEVTSAAVPVAPAEKPAPAAAPAEQPVPAATAPGAEFRSVTNAPHQPEQAMVLSNGMLRLTLSSWGGGVKAVELPSFSMINGSDEPVVLDFARYPALVYEGLSGLSGAADFSLTVLSIGAAARLEAAGQDGVRLVRTISLGARYEVKVEDAFYNDGAEARTLPAHAISLGDMAMLAGESEVQGLDFLAVDSLASAGGESVRHWAYKRWFSDDVTLVDYFQEEPIRGHGCIGRPRMTRPLPHSIRQRINGDLEWVAVKNKFFVQILAPKEGGVGLEFIARRKVSPQETPADSRTWDSLAVLTDVASDLRFDQRSLASGASYTRTFLYYVGPKELSSIKPLGRHMKEVMDFGSLKWLCEWLVWSLRQLHSILPNYGVAIILLTLIVRILFWPLTHKGTESMKRLQELQPKVKELQAKYKDKPQKLQQETMAMYREHKVNPLGGCLPMLVQIPVFFALFNVLRSAIELRYAGFLWVADLSAPENLFAGMLPFGLALNILPLVMAATQAWQQHLTPSGGDPAQQKMMMFMPIIMLAFLYSMPSALVLYWTANQVLMIIQLLWQRRLKKA
jgi:YidC/Oxa1 family membrane protein insertase